MILVHRLRGEPFYVNPDLIESVEATPDTVLTLVDGRRIIVEDPPATIVERFTTYRASLLVNAGELRESGPVLSVVPTREG
ncbi:MAG: flagellar FlbD family protein [Nitriliruptoraceae bacterium]|nr:flagellar FlbD family protein [Nitriliruptoraceae bacterium]